MTLQAVWHRHNGGVCIREEDYAYLRAYEKSEALFCAKKLFFNGGIFMKFNFNGTVVAVSKADKVTFFANNSILHTIAKINVKPFSADIKTCRELFELLTVLSGAPDDAPGTFVVQNAVYGDKYAIQVVDDAVLIGIGTK